VAKGAGTYGCLAHNPTPDRSGEPTGLQAPVTPVLPKIGHVTAVRLWPSHAPVVVQAQVIKARTPTHRPSSVRRTSP
jgi:hypothetical protein